MPQLGQLVASLLAGDSATPAEVTENAPDLAGSRVFVVDDDIRNFLSLTSVLETVGIAILHAERGQEGTQILNSRTDIGASLIDITMLDTDGCETMGEIRKRLRLQNLALISVTAKELERGPREVP